jgi:release factor glutamine methyltransferase
MQIRRILAEASEKLRSSDCSNPRLDAETLLMHVLGRERAYLYAHPELELACGELTRYYGAIESRASGIPLQYITGHQEFWGLDFQVSPAVLIPRPETEHSVEAVLERVREAASPGKIVDVGTGSGCIAIALALELPNAEIHAVDMSPEALAVARENARRLGYEARVRFSQGDLLSGFLDKGEYFDVVVSNPPYVGEDEPEKVQREVREHEPRVAVFSGTTGMEAYERLIPQAQAVLKPGGWLVMEIGYSIEQQVRRLLAGWDKVHAKPDLQGIPRVMMARKRI